MMLFFLQDPHVNAPFSIKPHLLPVTSKAVRMCCGDITSFLETLQIWARFSMECIENKGLRNAGVVSNLILMDLFKQTRAQTGKI